MVPVRINGLAPGRFATDRMSTRCRAGRLDGHGGRGDPAPDDRAVPFGRYGDPLEFGRVAAFLLSPAASYVTGAIVPVDGGMIRALP